MYKGRKFDRDQLKLVVGVMLGAAVNYVESSLPPDGYSEAEWETVKDSPDWKANVEAAIGTTGWNLSVLYARLTDDGMGTGDAITLSKIDSYLTRFIPSVARHKIKQAKIPFKAGETRRVYPKSWDAELDRMTDEFIDECFDKQPGDYLKAEVAA